MIILILFLINQSNLAIISQEEQSSRAQIINEASTMFQEILNNQTEEIEKIELNDKIIELLRTKFNMPLAKKEAIKELQKTIKEILLQMEPSAKKNSQKLNNDNSVVFLTYSIIKNATEIYPITTNNSPKQYLNFEYCVKTITKSLPLSQ